MAKNPFAFDVSIWGDTKTKKKRQLTHAQKIYCWENNSHTCNICTKRVIKMSDAEFDHARSYSKGGATNLSNVKITHRQCNRLKGKKSLSETKKMLGIKSKTKRKVKHRSNKSTDLFAFQPMKVPKFGF